MALEITSSNDGVHCNGKKSAKDASPQSETTQKALKFFKKDIQKPA
jgi:hypothetical protein